MTTDKGGRPLKFKSVQELQDKIDAYFASCWSDEDDPKERTLLRPYTITGLALDLNTSRETLINYEKKAEFFDTIKQAKLKCHNYAEEYLFTGKNQAGAIFNLKANYKWVDSQTIEHTGPGGDPLIINVTLKDE